MTNKITQKNIFNIGDLITLRPYDDPNIVSHISLTETEWDKYRNVGRGILKIVNFSDNGNIGVKDKTNELILDMPSQVDCQEYLQKCIDNEEKIEIEKYYELFEIKII